MKMRVLGCYGGELPKHRTTCFLLDGTLALDAGALTSSLSLKELERLDDIVLTHSHLDHIKDLPLLADLMVGQRKKPIIIHASTQCAKTLRDNVFNNKLWPDFTRIPTRSNPVLVIKPFKPNNSFTAGKYKILPIPMSHPVETCGLIVQRGKSVMAMSGDTGPTKAFWDALNKTSNVKLLLLEASFPNSMHKLATVSGHLTPKMVKDELAKFDLGGKPSITKEKDTEKKQNKRTKINKGSNTRIIFYHMKPAFVSQIAKELRELRVNGRVAKPDQEIEI